MKPPRKVKRNRGHVWEVRYREGGRHRSRVFDRKADAEDFQADVRRRKQLGTLTQLHAGDQLLADFGVEWWRLHAEPNLQESTLRRYSRMWDRHVLPHLGRYRLREVTPEVVASYRAELTAGGVGDASIRKAMFMLQGVLGLAVLHGAIAYNPVKAVRKPRQLSRVVRPLAPQTVEAIRRQLSLRDATLVSVLAYAGLRPGEALALRWSSVRKRTLLIEGSISYGREKSTKTNATRSVRLLAPLAQDLAEWRLACGRPGEDAWIFARPDGEPWHNDDYRNWRKRGFVPAAKEAGLREPRPYDLRHSFVSLLINEGVSIVEVARQAGTRRRSACAPTRTPSRSLTPPIGCPRRPSSTPLEAKRALQMYAFCTRERLRATRWSPDLALDREADGGIRTLDPRFTRAVLWPTELRRRARDECSRGTAAVDPGYNRP
jgi:integrase